MSPLSSHSRRALVAATAALAAAPVAEAKKKRRKKKKKPAPPLAFAVVIVADLLLAGSTTFSCTVDGLWGYPSEGGLQTFGPNEVLVDFAASDQIRAQIAAYVQEYVSADLAGHGADVPAGRVAVTLF
jgi:hypothetical protein